MHEVERQTSASTPIETPIKPATNKKYQRSQIREHKTGKAAIETNKPINGKREYINCQNKKWPTNTQKIG
jgi:hypothetical protein